MSIRHVNSVMEGAPVSGPEFVVLMVIAVRANEDGQAWPSIERICRDSRLSIRCVQGAIKRLSDAGVIIVEHGGGRACTNVYTIPASWSENPAQHAGFEGEKPRTRNAVSRAETPHVTTETPHISAENPARRAPEPKEEPTLEPKGKERGKQRVPRGTRLPPDWTPSADEKSFAFGLSLSPAETATEADKFRDYWHARPGSGGVKLDWSATWRNWVRRAADDIIRRRPKQAEKTTAEILDDLVRNGPLSTRVQ